MYVFRQRLQKRIKNFQYRQNSYPISYRKWKRIKQKLKSQSNCLAKKSQRKMRNYKNIMLHFLSRLSK